MNLLDKIWARIDQTSDCWPWTGAVDKNGYGLFRVNGKTARIARVFWELLNGRKLLTSEHILHTCDSPGCMRPDHFFVGTHAENMADMAQKGRANKPAGSLNGRARFSEERVKAVRQDAFDGLTLTQLEAKYQAPRGTLQHIVSGRTW